MARSSQTLELPEPRRPRHVPTTLQMEATECGAACLVMLLAHYGRHEPLERIRELCQVSRDGATALQLAVVARSFGMEAHGARRELSGLGALSTPFIAYWGFNHFVVVEGWNRKGLFVNDPASGPRLVDWYEVDQKFTGIAIDIKPGPHFTPGGNKPSLLRAMRGHLRGYGAALSFTALLGIAISVPGIAAAGFLAVFINAILGSGTSQIAMTFVVGLLIAIGAQVILGWIQRQTLLRITTAFTSSLAMNTAWTMFRLPMRFFSQRQAGEIAWRLQMPGWLSALLAGPLPSVLVSGVSLIMYFAAMAIVSLPAALAGLAIALVNAVVLRAVARREREGRRLALVEEGKLQGVMSASLSAIEYVKSTGSEGETFSRFVGQQARVVNARQALAGPTQFLATVPSALEIIASAVVMGIAAMGVLAGSLTVGGLLALQVLMAGFLAPFAVFVRLGSSLQQVSVIMPKIDDILDQVPEANGLRLTTQPRAEAPAGGVASAVEPVKLAGRIEFRDVTFGYSMSQPALLNELSFTIEPGHRLAIVGTSGAGKSTVSRLLTGLERPWSGAVLLDGIPRDELPPGVITASMSMVDQSIVLFGGTIADNISMWNRNVESERIVAAARDAGIHDVIAGRARGYEAIVEEGGRNFSGGQAQRIEIARALAVDPTIIVLDEATSALDALTEVEIDNAIRSRGCTCVVISHRMSTIRDSDLILVLDKGAVVESGTHDELVAMDGLYRSLVQS